MKIVFLLLLSTICTFGISAQIRYENREAIPAATACKSSEAYLKKKVKAEMANFYKEYPFISVDFTSFKGQKGYSDKDDPNRIVYPYKIEMNVYLKRKVMKDGKELTEYSTWEYDSVFEYATKPGKKCEFHMLPSSDTKLLSREVL